MVKKIDEQLEDIDKARKRKNLDGILLELSHSKVLLEEIRDIFMWVDM